MSINPINFLVEVPYLNATRPPKFNGNFIDYPFNYSQQEKLKNKIIISCLRGRHVIYEIYVNLF